ncbi:MAG: hypothetical protein R3F37_02270 [Candidatus Competibacteraceae bacterium]
MQRNKNPLTARLAGCKMIPDCAVHKKTNSSMPTHPKREVPIMSEQQTPFNPFANFDLGKFDLGQFDVSKMLGNLQVPGFDINALMATQRKNLEALNTANKKAMESMQAIAKRQSGDFSAGHGRSVYLCKPNHQRDFTPGNDRETGWS